MGTLSPAAASVTRPDNSSGITDSPIKRKRRVTYRFKVTSSSNLIIPYAVAVDGQTLAAYQNKPRRVLGGNGSFDVIVDQGQRVHLYLNSDAHPSYRTQPVYAITAGDHDIVIQVTERRGQHADADTPVLQTAGTPTTPAQYAAPLTGDIWMKVSHRYGAGEVDAFMPAGTAAAVVAAIKSIYNVLPGPTLTVALPAQGEKPAKALSVKFEDSDNPKRNITHYSLLADGLPRVHPGGYAALINAALENDIPSLNVTSCWRPMLGSIVHRAGLGLDVNYVGATRMNREELRESIEGHKSAGNGNDTDNVSDAEVARFKEYEDAVGATKRADAELEAAKNAAKASGLSAEQRQASNERLSAAEQGVLKSADAEAKKSAAWNDERNAHEPSKVRLYRASLLKCSCVAQLFDPWFMDANTKDQLAPEPNMQRGPQTSNERLHSHHLHVTVHEPKIL